MCAQLCLILCDPMVCSSLPSLLYPWNFPGKNTGVGCHFLLQEIFPIQGLNPCLLYWQVDSVPLVSLGWFSSKDSACQCRRQDFDPWVGKIPWRRKWQPNPVFLPGKSHRQRSLVGYSPWDPKQVDVNEHSSKWC